MRQQLLPLFPKDIKLLTLTLGVLEKEGKVCYVHSGATIYEHGKEELHKFRFFTSNLLLQGLCKNVDIVRVFHVSSDSVGRWKKKLSEEGEEAFFSEENRHGRSYKLLPAVVDRIQSKLEKGQSVNSIAKAEGISEGSIRYALKKGRLKKKRK